MSQMPVLIVSANGPGAEIFFILVLVIIAVGLVQMWISRRRNAKVAPTGYTGTVLQPRTLSVSEPGNTPRPWQAEGRGWIVGQRSSARSLLEIREGTLTLTLRPWILQSVFGGHLHGQADDTGFTAFPVRWHGRMCVGLRGRGDSAYFESPDPQTVLAILAGAGFTVTWAEERARRF